jgi:hypothetical protein
MLSPIASYNQVNTSNVFLKHIRWQGTNFPQPSTLRGSGETDEAGFHEKKGKGIQELLGIMQKKRGYDIQRHESWSHLNEHIVQLLIPADTILLHQQHQENLKLLKQA